MRRLIGIVCIATLTVACGSSSTTSATPNSKATPTTSQSALLVFTNWTPDPKVSNGPEPGYKPAFTGLTSHDIKSASAAIGTVGIFRVVNVSFTSRGADLFKQLTRNNVAACPGDSRSDTSADCAQRHLGIWLDLMQADIDNWHDPTYAAKVSQPFDLDCLAHLTATTGCPKLVSNPVILQEIYGGNTEIGVFTKQIAQELADAINSTVHG